MFWVMKKLFGILLLLIIAVLIYARSNLRDRHPGYKADLTVSSGNPMPLKAGFSAVKITPDVPDRWTDVNGDAIYKKKDGDNYTDVNGNGKFDPLWIAGFSNAKPANGIHDDLWARTMILDDGKTRLSITVLDVIGLPLDHVIDIRKMIPPEAGITYAIISSTHTHEGPDLLGLWGKTPFRSGINKKYLEFVKQQTLRSIVEAGSSLKPVRLEISEDLNGAAHLVKDTRLPEVFDSGLRMLKAVDKETGKTCGTLAVWGNHPESLWNKNLLISSDFCHFARQGVEKGIYLPDSIIIEGTGGIALFAVGAVGGLMTPHPSLAIKDPCTDSVFTKPSFDKTEALGKQLSLLILKAMEKPAVAIDSASISLAVKTIILPIKNKLFRLAASIGILDRGTLGWMKTRTELAFIQLGPLSMLTLPGEIYPELVNGGVDAPKGGDFSLPSQEIPPLRDLMPGKFKFVIGMANDEIGYIIPKSQWDVKPPYAYKREKPQYGEENSLGPETAPLLYGHFKELLKESGK